MFTTRLGAIAAASFTILASTTGAQAICSNNWADVSLTCPQPVPFTGPKHLTDTSRNLPTVGQAATYQNWNNLGYDVKVVLHGQGSGHQPFHWQKQ